jgi:hypothetical protein
MAPEYEMNDRAKKKEGARPSFKAILPAMKIQAWRDSLSGHTPIPARPAEQT